MNAIEMIADSDLGVKNTVAAIRASGIKQTDIDLILEWLVYLRINRNLSPNTIVNYGQAQLDFAVFLHNGGAAVDGCDDIDMVAATPAHADEWHKHLALGKLSVETRALRLSGMRQFYLWADYKGYCVSRMHAVRGPKRGQKIPKLYSDRELQEFFASCDLKTDMGVRDYAVLMFFLGTGARRVEVERLTLNDLQLNVNMGGVRLDGKGSKERMVAFDKPVVDALNAWLHVRAEYANGHDFLFIALNGRTKGEPLGAHGLDGVIGRVAKCSGNVSEGLHRLRAVFATQLYEENRDIELVRVTLGHNDINTTRRYIAISPTARSSRMSAARLRKLTGVDNEQSLPRWVSQKT